jgi:hypothetical protein
VSDADVVASSVKLEGTPDTRKIIQK